MSTPRLGLSTVPSGSLQPSVPINESLQLLDALVQAGAVSALRNTPPPTTDADAGAVYIVGDTPTGAWAGHGLSIALCTAANTWYFLAPKVGYTLYVHDQGVPFVYHSTGWAPAARVATKTASTDLALSDADVLLMDSSASNVVTLQPDTLVPIKPGRRFTVVQKGVGATSIAAASGVTVRTAGSLTLGTQYAAGTLTKIGGDEWLWTVIHAGETSTGARTQVIPIACSDETTAITAGAAKVTFRMPYAFTLSTVRASLTAAQSSGSIFTVDVKKNGATIFSTKITIDNAEKSSATAATPPVLSVTSLADDDEITIDVDQIGDGTAKGLKVYLIGEPA